MRFRWLLLVCAPIALAQTSIDFSYAGYGGGGIAAPHVAAAISVRPTGGDDTGLLQAALDRIAQRGGALLLAGRFRVAGHLRMQAGDVVLRGGTIVATGTSRRTLIEIGTHADPKLATALNIAADVPVGGRALTLESVEGSECGRSRRHHAPRVPLHGSRLSK